MSPPASVFLLATFMILGGLIIILNPSGGHEMPFRDRML